MKKYKQIYEVLYKEIMDDKYAEEDFLPTEHELCEQFGVSRDTIRKSLNLLARDGLIRRRQGQGSQVMHRERINFQVSDLVSYQELNEALDLQSKTNVVSLEEVIIDKDLSEITGFVPGEPCYKIVRQRIVNDAASVLDIDYLAKRFCPSITRDIAEKSIFSYLEENLGLEIDWAEKTITIDPLTDMDRLLLDIGGEHHVASVASRVFLKSGQQFQYTDSRHKLDKFRFVDIAKRKK